MIGLSELKLSLLLCGAVIQIKDRSCSYILKHPVLAIVDGSNIMNPNNIPISKKSFRNSITFYVQVSSRILRVKYFRATNKLHVAGITTEDLSQLQYVVSAVTECFVDVCTIKKIYPISGRYSTSLVIGDNKEGKECREGKDGKEGKDVKEGKDGKEKKYIDLKAITTKKELLYNFRIQYDSERHSALILRELNTKRAVYIFNSGIIKCIAKNKIEANQLINSVKDVILSVIY
jgi:hypothetical protein